MITTKPHAHLQTLAKTPAKFQKDPAKTAGGVAFTRVDTFCDGQSDRQTHKVKQYVSLILSPDPDGGRHNSYLI